MIRTIGIMLSLSVVLVMMGTTAAPAQAEQMTAQQVLEMVDGQNNLYEDQEMKLRMLVIAQDGSKQIIEFSMLQKGNEKRLLRFQAPGTMKGMAVLIQSRNNMYVYLRNMNKLRRVASHNMKQPFAGSDFTQDDMAMTEFAKEYEATMDKEDDEYWYIKGVPRKPENQDCTHVLIKVSKADRWFVEMTYHDAEGPYRRLFTKRLRDWPGGGRKQQIVGMENLRTGHKSIMQLLDFKVNQGVPDSYFTTRYLRWGR